MNVIDFKGIETNNLKNIDVSIIKKTINIVVGPSGSGKSSLAYDTIAEIGQYEFNSMFSDTPAEPNFKVLSYSNMIATIPIKQTNNNNNIRSTIGTYFNINSHVAILYSALLDVSYDFFILNKETNFCLKCHGLGYVKALDINKIIDFNIAIEKCPVKFWVKYKSFYTNIINIFCQDMNIDIKKKFKDLTPKEKELLLFGESDKKYIIRFKKNGVYSNRTTKFFGILTNIPMLPKFTPNKLFYSEKVCPNCNGQKYSPEHQKIKIHNVSIGELMCTPFSKLDEWIKSVYNTVKNSNLLFSLQHISNFVNKAKELNLGHLFLNRAIPSLSGGELQRIRLVQVFNTQLTDLLIVLDEPLAGLSFDEKQIVYKHIKNLSGQHTLLVIDHHNFFYNDAKNIIALGEGSGKYGGKLCDANNYIKSQKVNLDIPIKKEEDLIKVNILNPVYDYMGLNIEFAKERLNLISGRSGIGKSTMLREYLSQYFDNYTYINQKPLMGNSNSNVATALNIYNLIIENFASKYKKAKYFFSNQTGCEGTCTSCSGTGKIIYGNEYQDKIQILCKDCNGSGFNRRLFNFQLDGKNIFDIWFMTIDEAYIFFRNMDTKISKILAEAKEIMLDHLVIGQPTYSLSGGENIRIKILKSLKTTSIVYGIDEPFRGLNNTEIYKLALFFNKFIEKNKTVIVADHEDESFKYFTRHLMLTNEKGILVGNISSAIN